MRNRMTSASRWGLYTPQQRSEAIQRGIVEIQRAADDFRRRRDWALTHSIHTHRGALRADARRAAQRVPLAKRIADFFTLMRVVLGLSLVSSGLINGQAAPTRDIWLLVMAWSTDMVDGRISRSMNTSGKTWLGKHDVHVDMFVSALVLLYLAVTNLLPLWLLGAYLLLWTVLILKWGLPPIFAQSFQNPIYAYFVFATVKSAPEVLPWLLLWALVSLAFFWRRLFELLKNVWATVVK